MREQGIVLHPDSMGGQQGRSQAPDHLERPEARALGISSLMSRSDLDRHVTPRGAFASQDSAKPPRAQTT